ncbi:MAG: site-2 protease family protein [Ruminococcaceae bacterium]|nr:site-2 protease family protein [Oscillospiraceae bacterium]
MYLIVYVGSIAFVVFCTLPLHEFAHAFAADKLGDDTPRRMGRLTVSPLAHISPLGALMIFLCGFGYAKPVPVRMKNFKNPKRDMALVALAGPLCNILQAFVYMFLYSLITSRPWGNQAIIFIALFFFYAADVNIGLAVFNLLPIPPLDGSRLATALLPAKYYYKVMEYERQITIVLFILIVTGVLSTPIRFISEVLLSLISVITQLPF